MASGSVKNAATALKVDTSMKDENFKVDYDENERVTNSPTLLKMKGVFVMNFPPRIGEYVYFDARMATKDGWNDNHSWIVNTENKELTVSCHYSSPHNYTYKRHVTNHGRLVKIVRHIESIALKKIKVNY
tara:strand:+ start:512 stop:901 length:390 start_codon:yes stop_codon:yes gene_type:complete